MKITVKKSALRLQKPSVEYRVDSKRPLLFLLHISTSRTFFAILTKFYIFSRSEKSLEFRCFYTTYSAYHALCKKKANLAKKGLST